MGSQRWPMHEVWGSSASCKTSAGFLEGPGGLHVVNVELDLGG